MRPRYLVTILKFFLIPSWLCLSLQFEMMTLIAFSLETLCHNLSRKYNMYVIPVIVETVYFIFRVIQHLRLFLLRPSDVADEIGWRTFYCKIFCSRKIKT